MPTITLVSRAFSENYTLRLLMQSKKIEHRCEGVLRRSGPLYQVVIAENNQNERQAGAELCQAQTSLR